MQYFAYKENGETRVLSLPKGVDLEKVKRAKGIMEGKVVDKVTADALRADTPAQTKGKKITKLRYDLAQLKIDAENGIDCQEQITALQAELAELLK